MSRPTDISPVTDLKPQKLFVAEIGEDCLNLDGVISVLRQTDTPQAKAIYRAFRKRHALMAMSPYGRSAETIRGDAVLAAFEDCGHRITFKKVNA